jgi:hypothetical protein
MCPYYLDGDRAERRSDRLEGGHSYSYIHAVIPKYAHPKMSASLMYERLIDRSYIGFASAVFKDRREGAAGDSRLGLSKLNSMRPAR